MYLKVFILTFLLISLSFSAKLRQKRITEDELSQPIESEESPLTGDEAVDAPTP